MNLEVWGMLWNDLGSSQNDLSIISKDSVEVETLAGTLSGAGTVGVGGSIVINNVKNSSKVHIDNSKANAKGKLYMYSSNNAVLKNLAGSGTLGGFSGAAATIFNTVDSTTKSYTHHDNGKEILINQNPAFVANEQSVNIGAHDYVKIDDSVGAVAGIGIGAAGGSVDMSTLKNDTSAYLGEGTALFAKKDLDIIAKSNKDFSAKSAGAAAGMLGVAGSLVVANIGSYIEDEAMNALDKTKSVLEKTVSAINKKNNLDDEKSTVDLYHSLDKTTKTNKTEAHIGSNAKVNVGNDLNVNAKNTISTLSVESRGAAAGAVGAGGGATFVYLGTDNSAYTDKGVIIDAKDLDIEAKYDTGSIDIESHAGSLGAVALQLP